MVVEFDNQWPNGVIGGRFDIDVYDRRDDRTDWKYIVRAQ